MSEPDISMWDYEPEWDDPRPPSLNPNDPETEEDEDGRE